MQGKYIAPAFKSQAFHCPHCAVFARQWWLQSVLVYPPHGGPGLVPIPGLSACKCDHCGEWTYWRGESLISPLETLGPPPADDMPYDVQGDYREAQKIVSASPRGAAALLRLALQKLMPHLGEKGDNINDDIGALVKKGMPIGIQQAMDAVRVIGNSAVHPGQIDLKDDRTTALALFDLLNVVVQDCITQPKKIKEVYSRIPAGPAAAINKRDGKP